ncbi:putative TPR repeat-containing protein YrrB [Gammaproteobacteria bacterium]
MIELTLDQALQQAVAHHQAGRLQDAEHLYRAILKIHPNHPDANHNLGVLAVSVGRAEDSLPFLKSAFEAKPNVRQYWLSYVNALFRCGQEDSVRQPAEAGQQPGLDGDPVRQIEQRMSEPKSMESFAPAIVHREAGRYLDAAAWINEWLVQYPNDADAYAILAHILLLLKREDDARIAIDRALAIAPESSAVQRNLARLLLKQQQWENAMVAANQATSVAPDDPENLIVLATALGAAGRTPLALERLEQALLLRPDYAEAFAHRAQLKVQAGDLAGALADSERAVALKPWLAPVWMIVASLRHQREDIEGMMQALTSALHADAEQIDALISLGELKRRYGSTDEALVLLEKAVTLAPGNVSAWSNYGAALQQAERLKEARSAYKKALDINPRLAEPLNNLGAMAKRAEDWEGAVVYFEQALALRPGDLVLIGNLCTVLERTNRIERLRECLPDSLDAATAPPTLVLVWAKVLLRRDGNLEQARELLLRAAPALLNDPALAAEMSALLGEIHNELGTYRKAFSYFQASNQYAQQVFATQRVSKDSYIALVDRLLSCFSAQWIKRWTPPVAAAATPVFLVGFPRSGTTLLDSILRSHSAIAVVEEQPMVDRVVNRLNRLETGYPAALAALGNSEINELRALYFEELGQHLEDADRTKPVLIDKMPLSIIHAGLLQRLFPDVRFILTLRHPCDCVLSCFMHNFTPNAAMASFLTLEDTARLYDQVMRLWECYRSVLPLRVHAIRYEDLVADFTGNVGKLLDFLELPWNDEVTRYTETARRRTLINTPSYHQVLQPIYQRARGRWEQYREYMEPVLPMLQPWVERFGYSEVYVRTAFRP